MTIAENLEFVQQNHRAVLVTHRASGGLQMSPIVCAGDGEGHVIISVTQQRAKTKNVRHDPRVSLCVLTNQFFGPWVQIDGEAQVVDLPEAMEGLKTLYRQVQGEHPDWEEFERAMVTDERCLLRITLTDD